MPRVRSRYSERTSSQLRKRNRNSGTIVKIQIATSAFATASARNTCGIVQPSQRCTPSADSDASTMKHEFWMLSAAKVRDITDFAERDWLDANSGTTKKPGNRPIRTRYGIGRRRARERE